VTEGLIVARKMPKDEANEIGKQMLDKVGMSNHYDYLNLVQRVLQNRLLSLYFSLSKIFIV